MANFKRLKAFVVLSLTVLMAIFATAAVAVACSGGGGESCTKPSIISDPPFGVGKHGAFAEFLVSPHGCITSWEVKYGTSSPPGSFWSSGTLSSSTSSEPVNVTFTGLPSTNTQYYYRLIAVNSAGTAEGSVKGFKTLP
jgi:hypothetical protein